MIATILFYGLLLYVLVGLLTAALFVTFGLSRVLPAGTTVTPGARILFLPGATALWPILLLRWISGRDVP
jgi:hypothetical protein